MTEQQIGNDITNELINDTLAATNNGESLSQAEEQLNNNVEEMPEDVAVEYEKDQETKPKYNTIVSSILRILTSTSINLLLPFINGLMLGFGELAAYELGWNMNWFPYVRRNTIENYALKTTSLNNGKRNNKFTVTGGDFKLYPEYRKNGGKFSDNSKSAFL
ncbi:Mim1p SCDLUD_005189 [Saccharomycodes ludwigii]|uniref:Mim1p n=1 Tax=Saccharomycodes ludwigii TaxID=36035 RepID=UPI001E889C4A|nr:hypothetical protein SCDLUD_005189 [Saccharomycodes ludwigii]KAH3898850.1 hypothetical protein SCDLUD_005189 [Saccharomycodes ludwigii]